MTASRLALPLLTSALALTTGCGFVGGALTGMLFGDDPYYSDVTYSATDSEGEAIVCLGTSAELSEEQAAATSFDIRGRVVDTNFNDLRPDFDNVIPCWDTPETVIRVRDDAGAVWTIGFAWRMYGWDSTPWPMVNTDEPVSAIVRTDGAEAAGFALFNRSGLRYALEAGRGGTALQDGDLPSISFGTAEGVGGYQTDCGERAFLTQEFVSEESELVLFSGEDAGFYADDEYYTTCSITAYETVSDNCGDSLPVDSSWVMFR